MKRYIRQVLALLLALVMMFALTTVSSYAEETKTDEAATITGFVGLSDMDSTYDINYSDKPELEELLSYFPNTLEVYLNGGTTPVEIPVSWFCVGDDYETDDHYYYQFSPEWDESQYVLSEDIDLLTEAPYIFVRLIEGSGFMLLSVSSQSSTEQLVFEYLTDEMGLNTAAACGVMANIYYESSFIPNNLENTGNTALGMTDAEYTAAVDAGTYANFSSDQYGYGLVQWTYSTRKAGLLSLAQSLGVSIGDAEMQMEYLATELSGSYKTSVLSVLQNVEDSADGAYEAGYTFCYYFEAPGSKETVSVTRGNYARDTFWAEYYTNSLVYVNDSLYTGYYMDSDGLMYNVTKGVRKLKSGTLAKGTSYYSASSKKTASLSKQTVYVRGEAYTGYYMCSAGVMYKVTNGTRTAKTGSLEAGTSYYSYNSGKNVALSSTTVYVSGKKYTGYYTCSAGIMYKATNGTREKKTGTLESGTKYYSYNSGKTTTLSKQTVYVSGAAYTGYYTCSADTMYKVTNGTRVKKTGTLASGTSYYSYNSGKTVKLSANTVYVSGKKYTGYYTCSAGVMYKVSSGTRSAYTGTLSKGTTYYSYNDAKTMTLSASTTYSKGVRTSGGLSAVSLKSVTSPSSKAIKVTWTATSGVTGYQIQYCTTSGFSGTLGTKTVTGASTTSATITSLRNSAYYVRIRSYYTSGSSTTYSSWSSSKYITVMQ